MFPWLGSRPVDEITAPEVLAILQRIERRGVTNPIEGYEVKGLLMLIHCARRACERLKITPPVATIEFDPLYSWRLNIVEDGRKRLVVFMNDASRYTVTIYGLKAKDWAKLPTLFEQKLRNVLLDDQINPGLIDLYIYNAGKFEYVRNTDKLMTAWMNKACETACIGYINYDTDVEISRFGNHYLVGKKNGKDYWWPYERFYEKLSVLV